MYDQMLYHIGRAKWKMITYLPKLSTKGLEKRNSSVIYLTSLLTYIYYSILILVVKLGKRQFEEHDIHSFFEAKEVRGVFQSCVYHERFAKIPQKLSFSLFNITKLTSLIGEFYWVELHRSDDLISIRNLSNSGVLHMMEAINQRANLVWKQYAFFYSLEH